MTIHTKFTDPTHKKAHKQIIKWVVSRQISCLCGQILDVSNSVMIETDTTEEYVGTYCGTCFDELIKGQFPQHKLEA